MRVIWRDEGRFALLLHGFARAERGMAVNGCSSRRSSRVCGIVRCEDWVGLVGAQCPVHS